MKYLSIFCTIIKQTNINNSSFSFLSLLHNSQLCINLKWAAIKLNCFIEINFECQPEFFLWWLFHNWRGQKGLFEKLSLEPSTPILKVLWKCNSKLINPWFKEFDIWSTNNTQIDMFLYFYHLSAGYCNENFCLGHLRSFMIISFQHLSLFSKCSSFTHFYRCIHFLVPASGKHGLWGSRHSSSPSLTQEILFSS